MFKAQQTALNLLQIFLKWWTLTLNFSFNKVGFYVYCITAKVSQVYLTKQKEITKNNKSLVLQKNLTRQFS